MKAVTVATLLATLFLSALLVSCGAQLGATYRLNISSAGNGQVAPNGLVKETNGSNIQITATASQGYHFVNWSVASGSATIANSTDSTTTVSLTGGGVLIYGGLYYADVVANFAPGPAAPVFSAVTGGPGEVTLSWSMQAGVSYNLYWAAGPLVSTSTGTKIAGATSPETVSGLVNGSQYAFALTAVAGSESQASGTVIATPEPVDYIYVTGPNASQVLGYRIQADGTPAAVPGAVAAVGSTPSGIATTANGSSLYVANYGSYSVSGFSISADGSLTPVTGSPFVPAGSVQPEAIVTDSVNGYLYLTDPASSDLSVMTIGSGGALSDSPGSPHAVAAPPFGAALTPNGKYVYLAEQFASKVAAYAAAGGTIVQLSSSPYLTGGANPITATVTPNGQFLYTADNGGNDVSMFSIDSLTGTLTLTGTETANVSGPSAIVASPNGNYLYVANNLTNTIAEYDIGSSGALTPMAVPTVPTGSGPVSLAVTPEGTSLYAANANDNTVSAYSIDSTGTLIPLPGSPYSPGISVGAIAIAHVTK